MNFPVSIKGVCFLEGAVLLLKNDRAEWELPGGRLESSAEGAEEALQREFWEEAGLVVNVVSIVDSWLFEVLPDKYVFIVTYLVEPQPELPIKISGEHTNYLLADPEKLPLNLPQGYVRSVKKAIELRQAIVGRSDG